MIQYLNEGINKWINEHWIQTQYIEISLCGLLQ